MKQRVSPTISNCSARAVLFTVSWKTISRESLSLISVNKNLPQKKKNIAAGAICSNIDIVGTDT